MTWIQEERCNLRPPKGPGSGYKICGDVEVDGSLWVRGALVFKPQLPMRFQGTAPVVTGSRGGNAALASLLTGLSGMGLIGDNTTP